MGLTEEEADAWVARHLAQAPEPDAGWAERVIALYVVDDVRTDRSDAA